MSDIVERARSAANWSATHQDLLNELAAEIERLRAALEEISQDPTGESSFQVQLAKQALDRTYEPFKG